ncbi:Nuclear transcription factor Y subunit A-3 [Bienertia sinuspersici]
MKAPAQRCQSAKLLDFSFQDQDSCSTQSTGQSYTSNASFGENDLNTQSMSFAQSGYTPGKHGGENKFPSLVGTQNYILPPLQTDFNHAFPQVAVAFPDQPFNNVMSTYGPQAVMMGIMPARVPLPIDYSASEPIYVNAKQYHGILRRRQHRAKLEAQNKVAKQRKLSHISLRIFMNPGINMHLKGLGDLVGGSLTQSSFKNPSLRRQLLKAIRFQAQFRSIWLEIHQHLKYAGKTIMGKAPPQLLVPMLLVRLPVTMSTIHWNSGSLVTRLALGKPCKAVIVEGTLFEFKKRQREKKKNNKQQKQRQENLNSAAVLRWGAAATVTRSLPLAVAAAALLRGGCCAWAVVAAAASRGAGGTLAVTAAGCW